jgi:hypothetical protein
VKTKIFFTVMPDELLALPTLETPQDVAIALTAAIAVPTTPDPVQSIGVTALTGPVPAGTAIPLTWTDATLGVQRSVVYTAAHAKTGDTNLVILPATEAVPSDATGTYVALLLLQGGTTSNEQIQNQDQTVKIYQDEFGSFFDDGMMVGANWQLTYSFNHLSDDLGYYRLAYAGALAGGGVRGYVKRELEAPPEHSTGKSIEGLVDLMEWSAQAEANGLVTGQTTFKGRGAPIIKPPAK